MADVSPLVVLVGYDESPAGRAAVETAADLTRRLDGELRVVHAVVPAPPLTAAPAGLPGAEGYVLPPAESGDQVARRAGEDVGRHVAELLAEVPVRWEFQALTGDAVTVLEEQGEAVDAYVVVVGTRHAGLGTALERLVGGSTSRGLQRRTTRPVLVVPEPHDG